MSFEWLRCLPEEIAKDEVEARFGHRFLELVLPPLPALTWNKYGISMIYWGTERRYNIHKAWMQEFLKPFPLPKNGIPNPLDWKI